MKESKTLLLRISTNAAVSKWMPWELGFMDGFTGKCAIIPVSNDNLIRESYTGFEYLSLYPFVKEYPNRLQVDRLWVVEEANKYVVFDDWFQEGKQPFIQDILIY